MAETLPKLVSSCSARKRLSGLPELWKLPDPERSISHLLWYWAREAETVTRWEPRLIRDICSGVWSHPGKARAAASSRSWKESNVFWNLISSRIENISSEQILCRSAFSTLSKQTTGVQVSSHILIKFSKARTSRPSRRCLQSSLPWRYRPLLESTQSTTVLRPHVTKGSLIPFRLISNLRFHKNKGSQISH